MYREERWHVEMCGLFGNGKVGVLGKQPFREVFVSARFHVLCSFMCCARVLPIHTVLQVMSPT